MKSKFILLVAFMAVGMFLNTNAFAAKRLVVVWSEGTAPKNVYPNDINGAIAEGLKTLDGWEIVTASIDQPEQGLPEELLNKTDVLIWWGHKKHKQVEDALVAKIVKRVKEDGMGFISLHSSHFAKPNKALMGTACSWGRYTTDKDKTSLDVVVKTPTHPIAKGVKDFHLKNTERYSEPYAVPEPEAVVFDGVYNKEGGEKENARQGLCWTIGKGRMFYFQPGHETYPHFFDPNVCQLLRNAVEWAAPQK
jgi:trehalose utilization protein